MSFEVNRLMSLFLATLLFTACGPGSGGAIQLGPSYGSASKPVSEGRTVVFAATRTDGRGVLVEWTPDSSNLRELTELPSDAAALTLDTTAAYFVSDGGLFSASRAGGSPRYLSPARATFLLADENALYAAMDNSLERLMHADDGGLVRFSSGLQYLTRDGTIGAQNDTTLLLAEGDTLLLYDKATGERRTLPGPGLYFQVDATYLYAFKTSQGAKPDPLQRIELGTGSVEELGSFGDDRAELVLREGELYWFQHEGLNCGAVIRSPTCPDFPPPSTLRRVRTDGTGEQVLLEVAISEAGYPKNLAVTYTGLFWNQGKSLFYAPLKAR